MSYQNSTSQWHNESSPIHRADENKKKSSQPQRNKLAAETWTREKYDDHKRENDISTLRNARTVGHMPIVEGSNEHERGETTEEKTMRIIYHLFEWLAANFIYRKQWLTQRE